MCHIGPVLLEDYQTLEKIATFDREKIPERVVHARGAVAKGYFEVRSHSPDLLQVGARCHMLSCISGRYLNFQSVDNFIPSGPLNL